MLLKTQSTNNNHKNRVTFREANNFVISDQRSKGANCDSKIDQNSFSIRIYQKIRIRTLIQVKPTKICNDQNVLLSHRPAQTTTYKPLLEMKDPQRNIVNALDWLHTRAETQSTEKHCKNKVPFSESSKLMKCDLRSKGKSYQRTRLLDPS